MTGILDTFFAVLIPVLLLIGFGCLTWTGFRERSWLLSSILSLGVILSGVGVFLVIGGMVGLVEFSIQECPAQDLSKAPIRGATVAFLGELWSVFASGVLTIGIALAVGHFWRERRYLVFAVLLLVELLMALIFAISVGDLSGLIELPVADCPKH